MARGQVRPIVPAIGSGDIEVDYRVSTPDGSVLSESAPVLVRMRAGWEDALTITAAGALGLLFVGGLVRTLRSRARESRDDTTDGE